MNRYRIYFSVLFEHVVTAEDIKTAKRIAEELTTMPLIALTSAQEVECCWNAIKPLSGVELPVVAALEEDV
jgi:hypothetical protein